MARETRDLFEQRETIAASSKTIERMFKAGGACTQAIRAGMHAARGGCGRPPDRVARRLRSEAARGLACIVFVLVSFLRARGGVTTAGMGVCV